MKKIAVGDLGEFWYGDYKEPFEQLEGAVPGHPVGVVLKDDDGRLLCAYCGGTFDFLAAHVQKKHHMTARQYKDEVGLLVKSALVSERVREKRIATGLRIAAMGLSPVATGRARPPKEQKRLSGTDHPKWSPEHLNKTGRCYAQVLATGRSVLRETGKVSSYSMKRRGIGNATIETYFGTWENFRRALGMGDGAVRSRRDWTDTQLLTGLRSIAEKIARTPASSDLRRFGLPSPQTYQRRFGSFTEACRRAGLEPNLPMAESTDTEVRMLVAYATLGNTDRAAKALHTSGVRYRALFAKYGAPFVVALGYGRGHDNSARRAWAAEMARRLAGTAEAA